MPLAKKAGRETYWTVYGQGPQPALMIHCSLAQSKAWGGLAKYLSGALTMTAFDMPGHGRSAAWDGRSEIQQATAEIGLDFLNRPATVIGHSFGATVALRMAVMRPDLVQHLVLIEPVIFSLALQNSTAVAAQHQAETADFVAGLEAQDYRAAAQAFLRLWGDGVNWEDLPDAEQARLAEQMPLIQAGHAALYEDVGQVLVPGRLEALDTPVLLIEGSQSPAIIGLINTGLQARLPAGSRAVIVGGSHMVPITHPKQVSTEILRFMQSVQP